MQLAQALMRYLLVLSIFGLCGVLVSFRVQNSHSSVHIVLRPRTISIPRGAAAWKSTTSKTFEPASRGIKEMAGYTIGFVILVAVIAISRRLVGISLKGETQQQHCSRIPQTILQRPSNHRVPGVYMLLN
jgi:hypothetical protein